MKSNSRFGKILLASALVGVFTLLASCRKSGDAVARGKAAFNGFGCAKCHQIGNEGNGVYGPNLTHIGFRKSKEWLDLWLKNPHAWKKNTAMPNFNLPEPIRKDIVEFLAAQQGQAFEATGGKPWDAPELADNPVERGKVLFKKVGCVGCHGPAGIGGNPNNNVAGALIPSLTKVAEGYSKHELKERIADGRISDAEDPSQPAPMIRMPAWKEKLTSSEMDALVEYLYSLKPANSEDSW